MKTFVEINSDPSKELNVHDEIVADHWWITGHRLHGRVRFVNSDSSFEREMTNSDR